jgi:molybdopterin-containing oxidoreductase family membrane subunit
MFWDISALSVYFLLCVAVLTSSLVLPAGSHPAWLRRLALTSVPFAFGIHIVTALLYAGLSARASWMTAILAPKFLATAFASGSSLLLLMATALTRTGRLSVKPSALTRLATIMTYALCATLLFSALEVFTAVYSGLPATEQHALHLLVPSDHATALTWLMLVSLGLDCLAVGVLLIPAVRRRPFSLTGAGAMIILATLLEKGLIFIPSGFTPSALGENIAYLPSIIEVLVVCGVYSGALLIFIALIGPAIAHARELGAAQGCTLDSDGSSAAATVGKACAQ